jgi:hypothetical protein
MSTQADHIIEKFGGVNALARLLRHKHPTTVSGWKKRGFIPASQQEVVLAVAQKHSIPVSPEDFFKASQKKRPTKKAH